MIDSSENNVLLLILSIMIARIYVVHILSYTCTEFQKVPLNILRSGLMYNKINISTPQNNICDILNAFELHLFC